MGKGLGFCPFSLFLFGVTAVGMTYHLHKTSKDKKKTKKKTSDVQLPSCTVIFVIGAPGTGKGTQCQLLVERSGNTWTHLSAGDLLRAERKRVTDDEKNKQQGDDDDMELAYTIENCINAGKLVPSSITVRLLEKGMKQSYRETGSTRFLLDGFPRGQDNIDAWDERMKNFHQVTKILNFECPEEVLVGRLLERGKSSGRTDDNIQTIRKRFQTHVESSKPVLERYKKDGILHTIEADRDKEVIYKEVEQIVGEK